MLPELGIGRMDEVFWVSSPFSTPFSWTFTGWQSLDRMTEVGVVDGSEMDDMGGSEMCIVGGTGWGWVASGVCVAGRWLRAFFERLVLGRGGGSTMSGGGSIKTFGRLFVTTMWNHQLRIQLWRSGILKLGRPCSPWRVLLKKKCCNNWRRDAIAH